ncbi:WxL domain-containing protein [Vagococcus xieshaowenii]|uniref:WxL domain-containing protein n=1 Tax=Vagococcus xieshaowenii TaxID=2562451 RepID=A0AAJ5EDL8_9ENTE|nr:WxL domain-containing protein [Vagococcus xieshaowenii]QCA29455.1 WxL domain-containing protein [Vagococcus xieshaowenii]TFZ39618.1 WxL domain-containing protein [Vagococcus xieshaowenii]
MRKQVLAFILLSTMVLSNTSAVFAAEFEPEDATSEAAIHYKEKDGATDPLDPDGGGVIDPVDPENPDTGNPGTGLEGPLTIDFVSKLYFGSQAISSNDETYHPAAQPSKVYTYNEETEENDLTDYRFVNNYVQVTDGRGVADAGWTLSVTQEEQFSSSAGELEGAALTFNHLKMTNTGNEEAAAPQIKMTNEEGHAIEKHELDPGTKMTLVEATEGQGIGTWFLNLGQELVEDDGSYGDFPELKVGDKEIPYQISKDIQLDVPGSAIKMKDTTYKTDLTWTLEAIPSASEGA